MVKQGITDFVKIYICSIKNYGNIFPVHFVGSVPHFFEENRDEVLEEYSLIKGKFEKKTHRFTGGLFKLRNITKN